MGICIKMNNTGAHSDSEMENKVKTKEGLMLDSCLPKEERCPIPDLVKKIKTEDAVCTGGEAENKMKIKEEPLVIDIDLQNEDACYSLNSMEVKNNSDVYGIVSELDIKEEPWWQERISPEVKCLQDTSYVSDCQVYSEIKGGANEDFSATEATRFCTETATASSACSNTTYLLITADLEERVCQRNGKDNAQFETANVYPVYGSVIMETPYVEQSVQYHELDLPREHEQDEKLHKYSNSRNKVSAYEIIKNSFNNQNALKPHIFIHEDKRPYKCDVCGKTCTNMSNFESHMLIHEDKRPYKCDVCEKRFTQTGALRQHSFIHEGKRPYKCYVCEKNFTQMGNLKRHVLIHEGKRPYKCHICERSFTQKVDLKRHILIHEGKGTFTCNVCKKSFSVMGDLKRHILIHETETQYKCRVCEKSFIQMGHLKRHILSHENRRPYKCSLCEKLFTQQGNLKRHVLIHYKQRP